jgi:hypothetical protein
MTIEITGSFETPACDQPGALQQNGVQAQERIRRFRSLRHRWPLSSRQRQECTGRKVGGSHY